MVSLWTRTPRACAAGMAMALALLASGTPHGAAAQSGQHLSGQHLSGQHLAAAPAPGLVHIRNHRGGFLPRVVAEMQALHRAGVEVRIDGGFCFSACTVFLAAERACVAPWTRFGFHAPSDPRTGRKLQGAAFEHATAHVAGYYRPALARWWMARGRHTRDGLAMLTGAELIAMGYPACDPRAAAHG